MRTRAATSPTPSPSSPTADPGLARLRRLPQRRLAGDLTLIQAHSVPSRLRGLGGLASLPPGMALEIPTSSVHTFTVGFGLDLIWLARDGRRVLRIDREVPRRRVRLCLRAGSVIETNAGQADAFVAALSGD